MPTDCSESHACPPRPRPAVCCSATKTAPSGSPCRGGVHGFGVGRADAKVMMNVRRKHCAADQRAQRVGQKKIGNSVQLIPRGQMAGDLHAQLAQILHRAPNLGARCAQLVGNARAADDHGSVVAQQTNDAAKPSVSRAFGLGVNASWRNACDRKIMREEKRNEHPGSGKII